MQSVRQIRTAEDQGAAVRAFLIADIRGYSTFTRERGHSEAAKLAARFVDLASDAIEANGGRVVEIRGDEVLAVFGSALSATRAGTALQLACAEESARDPSLPVPAGVGVDAGESVKEGEHYHGSALNMAARLCSRAATGEVLVTRGVAERCTDADDLRLEERGRDKFKGFDSPVDVIAVASNRPPTSVLASGGREPMPLPTELDPMTPMVDRERELHWLRGTWRAARRGSGRVVFVSGPTQIGKTRLAAALAEQVHEMGERVEYAGPGGTAAAGALAGIGAVLASQDPVLLVLDDLDTTGQAPLHALAQAFDIIAARPVVVVCLVQESDRTADLAHLVTRADGEGNGHRILSPLPAQSVQEIARLYAGQDLAAVPVESVVRASGGVPGRVHEVMSDWAREETSRRLSAAAEYLAAGQSKRSADLEFANNVIGLKLSQLYTVEVTSTDRASGQCPYKGLAPFRGSDAGDFFGRERLIGELAARSVQFGLLGVVGDSGSGKSSVVAAGLLPSLRAGLLPGSERWQQVSMRPGEHPMSELLATARILVPDAGTDAFEQAMNSVGSDGRLVLFVDQFEELFTTCADEGERTAFVEALATAARSRDRFLAVVALRGDFYGACARYPEFAALLAANHVPVGPMTSDELRRAIELPARRAGLRTESALVDELLEDVENQPGALPLLSTALVELWQHRDNGWLRLETYQRTGGLRGAVARLAEATYEQLTDDERETARRIFLRLVGPGEGDAVTRRSAPISEFDLDRDEAARRVMERFTADRLLTTSASTVEVAHEALLREWPRLRGWIEEDLQGHQLRQHLTQAARQWEVSGRESSELYRGPRLSATLDWTALHGQDLNETERAFVQESRQAGEQETRRIRRTNRRLRGLLVGAAIFLIVALITGSVAFVQRSRARTAATDAERSATEAERSATEALSQSLGAQGVSSQRLDTGLLLAAQGASLDDSLATRGYLLSALERDPTAVAVYRLGGSGQPGVIAISPDGGTLAATNDDGELRFYDTKTREQISDTITDLTNGLGSGTVAFTPDGSRLLLQRGPGPAQMIDVKSHAVVQDFEGEPGTQGLNLSPNGRIAYDQGLDRWDTRTGKLILPIPDGAFIALPAVATDTGQVITLRVEVIESTDPFPHGRGWVEVRNGRTLALEDSVLMDDVVIGNALYNIAVSADASVAVINTNVPSDDRVRFVDFRTGEVTLGTGAVGGGLALMSPDGATAITDSGTDTKIWDVATAKVTQTIRGEGSVVAGMALDPSGPTLYVASNDGSVIAHDLSGDRGFGSWFTAGTGNMPYPWNNGGIGNVSASPDGMLMANTQLGGIVNVVEIATGRIVTSFKAAKGKFVNYAEFSPDGKSLITGGDPGDFALWRLGGTLPTLIRRFEGLPKGRTFKFGQDLGVFGSVPWATFSPDGAWIAAFNSTATRRGNDGEGIEWQDKFVEWNAATGALRGPLLDMTELGRENSGCWPDGCNVTWSPDGAFVAIPAGPKVVIIDAATVKIVHELDADAQGVVWASFSSDGRYVATAGAGGVLGLWDSRTWKEVKRVDANLINLHSVHFNESNDLLLVTGSGGRSGLWSVPELRQLGDPLPLSGPIGGWGVSRFAGPWIVIAFGNGHVLRYPATVTGWTDLACQVVGRNLTDAEWDLYVGSDHPYQKTCPEFP